MTITPETIKHQEFPMRLKGYDPECVRAFLADVARAYRATIRDQGAQWALANISDDLAGVLRAAHDAADRVVAQAEAETAEIEARATVQARAIIADANTYASKVRTEADDEMSRALEVLHRAQGSAVDVTRDAETAHHLLTEAQAQAAAVRAAADEEVAALRRETAEQHEAARLVTERAEAHAAELVRSAEAEARVRVRDILDDAQARLARLEAEERQLDERIAAVQAEFQGVLARLVGAPATTIDLTEDRPMVTIDGRVHSAEGVDLFATELLADRSRHLPGDTGSRVDPGTVQRMVAAAVDRAVVHSRA